MNIQVLAQFYKMLGDERRLEILRTISECKGSMNVTAIAKHVGGTISNTGFHLKLLKLAGIITIKRQGRNRFYAIKSAAIEKLVFGKWNEISDDTYPDGSWTDEVKGKVD